MKRNLWRMAFAVAVLAGCNNEEPPVGGTPPVAGTRSEAEEPTGFSPEVQEEVGEPTLR